MGCATAPGLGPVTQITRIDPSGRGLRSEQPIDITAAQGATR
jgi:hypothetical protein